MIRVKIYNFLGVKVLNNTSFGALCEYISEDERIKKFSIALKSENEMILEKGKIKYQIKYDKKLNQVKLSLLDEAEDAKNISCWLLDSESAKKRDIDFVAKDLISTISGEEKSKSVKARKKSKSSDDSNVTGLFFANRMVNIFPELKAEIEEEKEIYEDFRPATFAKEHILPKVLELLRSESEKARVNKFAKLISELYKNGTMDARAIITIVILNNIEDEKSTEYLKSVVSEELLKAWGAALKYKGKKIKPEKPKKKSLLSKALEAQNAGK